MKSDKWASCRHQRPLDRNNSTSGWQLPQSTRNRGISPSGYYSEDSDLDSASMTSRATSNVSIDEEHWTGRTYDQRINRKVALPKLNDESSTNDQWIWLADVHCYIDSGCSMSILESEINKSLSNGFWGVWF